MGIGAGSGEGRGQGHGKGQGHGVKESLFGACWIGLKFFFFFLWHQFSIFLCFCITSFTDRISLIIVVVLLVFVFFGLNIAKIVMGTIYLDECPIQKLIPIYLIVGGVVPFLMGTFGSIKKQDDPDVEEAMIKKKKVLSAIGVIAFLFNFAWLICGSVWVFGNFSDVMDGCSGSTDCCNTSLMKFALAVTIMDWIFYVFIFVALCCVCGVILGGKFCCKTKEVEP